MTSFKRMVVVSCMLFGLLLPMEFFITHPEINATNQHAGAGANMPAEAAEPVYSGLVTGMGLQLFY